MDPLFHHKLKKNAFNHQSKSNKILVLIKSLFSKISSLPPEKNGFTKCEISHFFYINNISIFGERAYFKGDVNIHNGIY